ncbi:hypothetical protein B0O99DRAFT_622904 [Bisporella sp. PMI_857]|nr:hypothetical protein B0O99DRAFT_622904 [Bisporella sp. PMI_857]
MEGVREKKPRRSHYKTRTGCVECKKRKIKCDEKMPSCRKCEGRGTPCSFSQRVPFRDINACSTPASQKPEEPIFPTSIIETSQSATFTTLDLELLYSWVTTSGPITLREKPSGVQTIYLTLVEIALQHPFLMHEILSLSALYLAQTKPDSATMYNLASTAHHDQALSLFQPVLATLSRSNSSACFAFSILLIVHMCATQATSVRNVSFSSQTHQDSEPIHISWIKIHRGNRAIHAAIFPWLEDGALAEFKPFQEMLKISVFEPLPVLEQQHLDAVAKTWNHSSYPPSTNQTLNEAFKELQSIFSLTHTIPNSMKHVAALAWFSLVPEDFVRLVESRVPEAMLILATYAVILKRIEHIWWCKGTGEVLLDVAMNGLGAADEGRWGEYLRWPIEEVFGKRQELERQPGSGSRFGV